MPMRRKRRGPLLRPATIVGAGAVAYHAGNSVQQGRDEDARQDEQIGQRQSISQLEQITQLRDEGVLTEEEFGVQRKRILGA
jgi:hypothetical protein